MEAVVQLSGAAHWPLVCGGGGSEPPGADSLTLLLGLSRLDSAELVQNCRQMTKKREKNASRGNMLVPFDKTLVSETLLGPVFGHLF